MRKVATQVLDMRTARDAAAADPAGTREITVGPWKYGVLDR